MQYAYSFPPTPKLIKRLIYLNVIVYIITLIALWMDIDLTMILGLVPYLVIKRYYVWQFFTYMFLHGSIFHLLFNMLMLWMFGAELCRLWGEIFFIKYYVITGIGGGLCVVALSLVFPSQYATPTIGASGAIFGLFLAYGLIFKNKNLYVFGLIPVKARPLVIIMGSIELVSLLSEKSSSIISHLAHRGGLFTGLVYLKIKEYERKLLIKKYTKDEDNNIVVMDFNKNRDKNKDTWN